LAKKAVKALVRIYPRPEILDPQGKAIGEALARLGFDQVSQVRAGKSFEITLLNVTRTQAKPLLTQMAERLLANTIMEEFDIEILKEDAS
jgi:phosphoribosylformylglycinamidine synthase PurS subunit